jgi:hypothetical protein
MPAACATCASSPASARRATRDARQGWRQSGTPAGSAPGAAPHAGPARPWRAVGMGQAVDHRQHGNRSLAVQRRQQPVRSRRRGSGIGRAASWISTRAGASPSSASSAGADRGLPRRAAGDEADTPMPASACAATPRALRDGNHDRRNPGRGQRSTEWRTTGLPRHRANCLGSGWPARRPCPAATMTRRQSAWSGGCAAHRAQRVIACRSRAIHYALPVF